MIMENMEYNTKNVGKEELIKSLECACADEFLIERYKVTEEAMAKGIEESWNEDKIWIIVTHTLSAVQQMNTIYVLHNGQKLLGCK